MFSDATEPIIKGRNRRRYRREVQGIPAAADAVSAAAQRAMNDLRKVRFQGSVSHFLDRPVPVLLLRSEESEGHAACSG